MRKSRPNQKRLIIFLAAGILALTALVIVAAYWFGLFNEQTAIMHVSLPGAVSAATADAVADFSVDADVALALRERTKTLLESKQTGLLASSYTLAGQFGKPAAVLSDQYLAADQLLFGQYLLEQGERNAYINWWNKFAAAYLAGTGLIRTQTGQTDAQIAQAGDFWRVNLSALRLLAQSCTLWPDTGRQAVLQQLSDQLLDLGSQGLATDYAAAVPTPKPILDPGATPTPKPTASPAATEAGKTLKVLRLASVDLFAMQQLTALDARWQVLYDRYLAVIKNGYIGDDLPLYALGYSEEQGGYLNYAGDLTAINTEAALLTMLHLCEVGEDNERSLNWLRDQMFNQHMICMSYNIVQGSAASTEESVLAYAIVARIARIKGDRDLYAAAVSRLLWHRATSQTSAALSAVFRENSDGQINVFAADNAWALLAMR